MYSAVRTSLRSLLLLYAGSLLPNDRLHKTIYTLSQSYGGRHEITQSPPIKEYNISFTLPNSGKTIKWTSEYSEDVGRANLHPLALHVLNGTPYIIAEPNLCLSYNKWGRPNPPYVIFKYDSKEWQRIAMQKLPTVFKDTNLVNNTKDHAEQLKSTSVVTTEAIRQFNSTLTQPEYKTILREALSAHPNSQTSCPISSNAAAKLIAPEVDGKPLYYNWWPLAQDWLNKMYGRNK